MPTYYEYRHIVGFEETNLVGNVYFANYPRWQGRVRESFLHEHAPATLERIWDGLKLFTTKLTCEYFQEITAFDELSIRMALKQLHQTQLTMGFEYWRTNGVEALVATGAQQIAFIEGDGDQAKPVRVPSELRRALEPYTEVQ